MLTINLPGSAEWTDPDDAPKLTPELLAEAEIFEADQFIRRQRGRPLSESRKEKINIRVDPDVLERLRASGPGWQSKINRRLAMMTGTDLKLWDDMERYISSNEKRIGELERVIAKYANGTMRSFVNKEETTADSLEHARQAVAAIRDGIGIMHQSQLQLFDKPSLYSKPPSWD